MNSLFQTYTLNNGVEIKNRLVVAPMTHFSSNENGTLSEQERNFLSNRAVDMGMFITAATLVAKNGKTFIGQPEALNERHLDSLRETATILKSQGTKAILQIHHGGLNAREDLMDGETPICVSKYPHNNAKEATSAEIETLIQAFANAADLAIRAGFDGVEIHGANGYLIQQFFSREFNQRVDAWGGSLEKRLRFPLAIIDAVVALKAKYSKPEFIVGYRFSPEEPGENGLTMEDTFALIDALVEKPLQYLHVSLHEFERKARRGADTNLTRIQLIHERINGRLPLIGVGGLLSGKQIRSAFQTGWAEFIGLGKAVMINANIATLLKENRDTEIVSELDPNRKDQYGMPDLLWSLCQQGGPWLPPVKGQDWKPLDI